MLVEKELKENMKIKNIKEKLFHTKLKKIYYFPKRLKIFFNIIINKKEEPFFSWKCILLYLLNDQIYPLKKYKDFKKKIIYNREDKFNTISFNKQKIYLPLKFSKRKCEEIINAVMNEQTNIKKYESPHKYFTKKEIRKDWIIYDVGAAEGLQSKEWIKKAKKIIIFEPDISYYDCLLKTFEKEIKSKKIIVLNKGLSDKKYENIAPLDHIIKKHKLPKPDYIKIDAEGYELKILNGAKNTLTNKNIVIQITTYHEPNDYKEIPLFLKKIGGKGYFSKGCMIFNRKYFQNQGSKKNNPIIRKTLYTHKIKK